MIQNQMIDEKTTQDAQVNRMRNADIGSTGIASLATDQSHTAASVGNPDVHAISTASLIVLFEGAAHNCLVDYFDEGEVSLGTSINIKHIAAAPPGTPVTAKARLTKQDGRRVQFSIQVSSDLGELLMEGTHSRIVVDLKTFMRSLNRDFR